MKQKESGSLVVKKILTSQERSSLLAEIHIGFVLASGGL